MKTHLSLMVVALIWLSVIPSVAAESKSAAEAYKDGRSLLFKGDFDSAIVAFTE